MPVSGFFFLGSFKFHRHLWEDERREAALQISTEDCRRRWYSRIQRAQELQGQHSAIANALCFYKATLEFQSDLACRSRVAIDAATPLRQQINVTAVCHNWQRCVPRGRERVARFAAPSVYTNGSSGESCVPGAAKRTKRSYPTIPPRPGNMFMWRRVTIASAISRL